MSRNQSLAQKHVVFHASFLGRWCCWSETGRGVEHAGQRSKGWLWVLRGSSAAGAMKPHEGQGASKPYQASNQTAAASSLLPSLPTDLFIISSCVICHNLWLVRPINHASEKMRFLTRRLSVSDKQGIIQLASFSKHLLTGFGKLVLFVI